MMLAQIWKKYDVMKYSCIGAMLGELLLRGLLVLGKQVYCLWWVTLHNEL